MDHISDPVRLPDAPPASAQGPHSMAEILAMIDGDSGLNPRRRSDMMSALRTMRRVLGTELSAIPASPQLLRPLFDAACPVQARVKLKRWRIVRSHVLGALIRAGVPALPSRSNESLSPEWARLSGLLPDAQLRWGCPASCAFAACGRSSPSQSPRRRSRASSRPSNR